MSTQDNINNAVTRHQIFVLRYAKGRENDAAEFISRQMIEVMERLESGSFSSYGSQRAEAQLKDLYLYLRETDKEYAEDFRSEIKRFADYEAEFNAKLISEEIGVDLSVPAPVQLQQAVFGDIMSVEPTKGYTIGSMLDDFGPAHANMVTSSIRSGFMLGDTTDQIARKIRGLIPVQQRKASTIARTVTNHASVQARKQTLKENDDVLIGYEWVSTLDGRTSLICMSRDGIIYKDYDKDPKPPAHFNCRSTIVPKVDPRFDLGADIKSVRPAKGAKGTKQVDSETNYSAWLRKQPKSFQNEVLGRKRADLFRGGMTLDRFVDIRGRPLTIAELGALDKAFTGVGVEDLIVEPVVAKKSFDISKKFSASSATAQEYEDRLFSQTSDRTEAAIRKAVLPKITDARGKGAVYDAWEKEINCSIDRGRGLSFIHEYGHHIDSTIGRTNPDPNKVRLFASEHDELFIKAFELDRKALGLHRKATKWDKLQEVRADMAELVSEIKTTPMGRERKIDSWNLTDDYYTQVMDIFDALTHGDARDNLGFAGHGRSYYKHKGSRYAETFAQLFSLDGAPKHVRNNVDRWFPNLKKRFHQIIDEYIESGVITYDG